MPFPDIFEQTVLTELIRRDWNQIARQGPGAGEDRSFFALNRIVPLVNHNGRHVKIRVQDILPTGMAQFRAPHADPALWTPRPTLREEVWEIVDIDEMHRIDPVQMLSLKSPDPNVLREAQLSITQRGAMLQQRNELRTEWMAWECLKGAIVIPFPNAGSITVNYGIPAGHFPNAGIAWTDFANSDPIEDLWVLGAVATADAGVYLPRKHMNTKTKRDLQRSQKVRDALSSYGRSVLLPTDADISALTRDGDTIELVDAGFLPEGATDKLITKFIGDDKVFATTSDYRYAGHRIADMKDGWTLVSIPGQEEPVARQGMQSEILSNKFRKQTFLRQASSRIPVMYAPEAIAWLETTP
jgi:hypothetical protein